MYLLDKLNILIEVENPESVVSVVGDERSKRGDVVQTNKHMSPRNVLKFAQFPMPIIQIKPLTRG